MPKTNDFQRLALVASDTDPASEAKAALADMADWVPLEEADAVVVLGGDGFMLQTLHSMLDDEHVLPAYGLNLGTVGFLMNRFRNGANLLGRIAKARTVNIAPLRMEAVTQKR